MVGFRTGRPRATAPGPPPFNSKVLCSVHPCIISLDSTRTSTSRGAFGRPRARPPWGGVWLLLETRPGRRVSRAGATTRPPSVGSVAAKRRAAASSTFRPPPVRCSFFAVVRSRGGADGAGAALISATPAARAGAGAAGRSCTATRSASCRGARVARRPRRARAATKAAPRRARARGAAVGPQRQGPVRALRRGVQVRAGLRGGRAGAAPVARAARRRRVVRGGDGGAVRGARRGVRDALARRDAPRDVHALPRVDPPAERAPLLLDERAALRRAELGTRDRRRDAPRGKRDSTSLKSHGST